MELGTRIWDTYNPQFFVDLRAKLNACQTTQDKAKIFQKIKEIVIEVFQHLNTLEFYKDQWSFENAETEFDSESAYERFVSLSQNLTETQKGSIHWDKLDAILTSLRGFSQRPQAAPNIAAVPSIALPQRAAPQGNDALERSRGDVPTSKSAFDINENTKKIKEFKNKERDFFILLACIDGEMRETVTLDWSVANAYLDVVNELLLIPDHLRDFQEAQRSLTLHLDATEKEELTCYKSLVGARTHYFKDRKEVKITKEEKAALLVQFNTFVRARFLRGFNEFTLAMFRDLRGTKRELERKIDVLMQMKDQMLESKVAYHMQAEDLMSSREFKALKAERVNLLQGMQAFTWFEACERGDLQLLEDLFNQNNSYLRLGLEKFQAIDGRNVNQKNHLTYTGLSIACYEGHYDVAKFLLTKVASRRIADKHGFLPLYWAARHGHTHISELLLSFDKAGTSIINLAALVFDPRNPQTAVGSYLSDEGTIGGFGRLASHTAAYHGHAQTLKFLIARGIDVNAQTTKDDGAKTALHEAVLQDRGEAIYELLQSGDLKVEIRDAHDRTSFHIAISLGRTDLAAMILGHKSYKHDKDPSDPNSIESLLKIDILVAEKKDKTIAFLTELKR